MLHFTFSLRQSPLQRVASASDRCALLDEAPEGRRIDLQGSCGALVAPMPAHEAHNFLKQQIVLANLGHRKLDLIFKGYRISS